MSDNDREGSSALYRANPGDVIVVGPALDAGDTCLLLTKSSPEDLTRAMGEAVSDEEGGLDMEQTWARRACGLGQRGEWDEGSRDMDN